jgi:hypothetical protein
VELGQQGHVMDHLSNQHDGKVKAETLFSYANKLVLNLIETTYPSCFFI